jgi:MFS family permease
MYSETDLTAAVAAGAISPEAAQALRDHAAAARSGPSVDEEHFRLITGFNDIFVTIAAVILLVAMAWIGEAAHDALAGMLVAASAWGLAEFFTRKRRMALPSIVLLLAFVGGVAASFIGLLTEHGERWLGTNPDEQLMAFIGAGIALATAGAALLHWRRFMVPITVAAGTAALVGTVVALIVAAVGPDNFSKNAVLSMVLVGGIGVFALAMNWDRSDRSRVTRRSDVAFWLHLLAAPMIAHPLFSLLGVSDDGMIGIGGAIGVIALYLTFGLIALTIDRRALLVSALAYVLFAMTQLFRSAGAVELNVALTALVIGSALLLLSAFWHSARAAIVGLLPDGVRALVPAAGAVSQSA